MFRVAHQALDLADVGAEEENMSEGKLRALWAAWQREQNIAPRYVADELDATHDAHRRATADATIWQARADTEIDPLVRDELAAAAQDARERAADLAVQVAQLDYADQARTAFLEETAITRDRAERARIAAGLKGVDLDNPGDRVTAQEWVDTHLVEQLAADGDRAITDDDITPDIDHDADLDVDDHETAGSDGRWDEHQPEARNTGAEQQVGADRGLVSTALPEAIAPDLRDTSTPDPSERADPARGRRVLPLDESAAAAERARRLIAEVAQRHATEQAAAAHAAELEAEDEQLRAEHARQAAFDQDATAADVHRDADDHDDGDAGEVPRGDGLDDPLTRTR